MRHQTGKNEEQKGYDFIFHDDNFIGLLNRGIAQTFADPAPGFFFFDETRHRKSDAGCFFKRSPGAESPLFFQNKIT
ncbi:MAG: hypothetical protein D6714_06475 [Bacteroidetes bacterium]|nr:MAG: hypothetical protein D6714_06475 [Bacteroidota bacterium]